MNSLLVLEPLDTLLFRDGRPFEQNDEGLTETTSLFPPFPSVVAGAARASLARKNGWDGRKSDWDGSLTKLLGSGPYEAGPLRFGPPVILYAPWGGHGPSQPAAWYPLFPCPAFIWGRFDRDENGLREPRPKEIHLLSPARQQYSLATDLCLAEGQSFPTPGNAAEGFEPLEGWFVNTEGLRAALAGKTVDPRDITQAADIFMRQGRVGLQRDHQSHGAVEGMLYAASQIRLRQSRASAGKRRFAIGVEADLSALNNASKITDLEAILPFGSLGRAATCTKVAPTFDLTKLSLGLGDLVGNDKAIHFSVTLLSPAYLSTAPTNKLPGLLGEIVSAVIPKPVSFSGWDGEKRAPAPMHRYFAPGSTWYLRFEDRRGDLGPVLEKIQGAGISEIGANVGFGAAVVGTWNFAEEKTS